MKNNGSQPSLGTKISFIYLKSIYIYIYRIQKFWGHMLRRHSNPTKNGPGKPSFWSVLDYGFSRVFMGLDEFLQVFGGFFCGLWRSCFIKNLVLLTKTYFFSQKPTQNKVLIARPGFFRDLVDVGCMMMISNCGKYLSQPSLGTTISFMYLKSIYIYLKSI